MSNPVTNVEIEDVLSSIRRLVAEGDKPRAAPEPEQTQATAAVTQPDRFVLTPAFRVADPVTPDLEIADNAAESDDFVASIVAPAAEPLVLEPAAIVNETLVHDEMSASERASLEATIAELEAAVSDQPGDWEPEVSHDVTSSGLAEVFADYDAADEIIEHGDIEEVLDEDEDSFDDADAADDAGSAEVYALHEQTQPAETDQEPTFRHTVPDDADVDYGDELLEHEDDGMPIPDDLDASIADYLAGGSSIDQDALRAMIVDVVRQELQGEMGERITRNVRKLVRREINNALSSKL